jgi:hypothetical protein
MDEANRARSIYNRRMERRAIEAFVKRDWDAVARSKTNYWVDRFRQAGWRATWQAADQLLADMRAARPDYPTARDREQDLADHLALRRALDCAAHAFARRSAAR